VTATIWAMRAVVAAALAACSLLVATGCGSSTAASSKAGGDAAHLVPSSALAFVSADTNLDSAQWGTVKDLLGPFELPKKLDYQRDVRPALGDQLNVAVLGIQNGKPEAVAIVKPDDTAKLMKLAAQFDQGTEHYTVQQIDGWSVVADSAESFQAVRTAGSGSALADDATYKSATSQLSPDALAIAYASGKGAQALPQRFRPLLSGSPKWVTAELTAADHAVRLDARASTASGPATYKPTLLRDVPSGAMLAVSFRNVNELLARLRAESTQAGSLAPLLAKLKGLTGEGVLSVAPSSLSVLPVLTLEVKPKDPTGAEVSLKALAAQVGKNLPLRVKREGAKVLLTNAAGSASSGGSLVDDAQFKDALAATDVPQDVTWLAYADVPRLRPLIQAFAALLPSKGSKTNTKIELNDKIGTVVAYGARTGSTSRLVVRATHA
jgi:hypothetical protein